LRYEVESEIRRNTGELYCLVGSVVQIEEEVDVRNQRITAEHRKDCHKTVKRPKRESGNSEKVNAALLSR